MNKIFLFFLFATLLFINQIHGQTNPVDSVDFLFSKQLAAFPQEKIYLQTDKSGYLSGERVWFRSHLVDAFTQRPIYISRYVYVELITPMEDLVERVMIRPDSTGAYAGYFDLPDDLIQGNYTIRAYTNYMRNTNENSFFRKIIQVLDPYSLQLEPKISFEVEKSNVKTIMQFIDRQSNDTVIPEIVTCKLVHKEARTIKPKSGNLFVWNATLSPKVKNRAMLLSLKHNGRKYNRFYSIPFDPSEYEVNFFPEGGYLIPNKICRVAFKALNPEGMGENISGVIYNSRDEEEVVFNTLHLGMGFFNLQVKPGESYYSICKNEHGVTKRFDLPQPETAAVALSVRNSGNRILVAIQGGDDFEKDSLSLLLHQKGHVIYHETLNSESQAYTFPAESLPMGILSVMLIDNDRNILSERLCFNYNEKFVPSLTSELSNPVYKRREPIELKIRLMDSQRQPLSGNMAVSVTDKGNVVQDTTNNIVAALLLESELKGFIESPASYLKDNKIEKYSLDALMMTQGWRRYNIPETLKGVIATPTQYEPELYQKISGKADGLFGSLKDGEISLMATLDSMLSTVTTRADEKGRFTFNVEYPSGTSILVQSLSRKGSKLNAINLDLQTFPEILGTAFPVKSIIENRNDPVLDAYLQTANEDYTQQHGIRTILLDEITVVAKSMEKYKESTYYSPLSATGIRTAEDIEKMKVSSLRTLLYTQPGVIVRSDKVTSTRSETPILFVIDDMRFEDFFDRLDDIDVNSIESLFVVRDNSMMPGYYPNTDGAIVITTKIGYKPKSRKAPNIDKITPLGYQQLVEFYSPEYETPSQKESSNTDFRTTLFWKPNLLFSENGEASIKFYAADFPTFYQVIFEGVSDDGTPVRYETEILIDDN